MRNSRASTGWSALLVAILSGLLALPQGPALAAAKPKATNPYSDRWANLTREIDEHLSRGEWEEGRRQAEKLLERMVQSIVSGEDVGAALATVLTYLALAEAGGGDRRAALWDWHTAQQLFPEVTRFDLSKFGDAVKVLAESSLCKPEEIRAVRVGAVDDPQALTPPVKLKAPLPRYPEAKRQHRTQVIVFVQAIVSTEGSVECPTILESKGELTMVLAALQAFKRWRFKPAIYQGEPVPAFYTLTVNFRLE